MSMVHFHVTVIRRRNHGSSQNRIDSLLAILLDTVKKYVMAMSAIVAPFTQPPTYPMDVNSLMQKPVTLFQSVCNLTPST